MKKCKKCGCENYDEAIICQQCWQSLTENQSDETLENNLVGINSLDDSGEISNSHNEFNENDHMQQNTNMQQSFDNEQNCDTQQNGCGDNGKKKVSKKVKFGIIGIVSLLVIILGLTVLGVFASPGEKIVKSLGKILTKEKMSGSIKLSLKLDQNLGIPAIVNDITLESLFNADAKSGTSCSKSTLAIKNKPVIDLGLGTDKENMYIDFYDAYEKYFFIKLNQNNSVMNTDSVKISKYIEKAKLSDILPKEYISKLTDILDKNITKKDEKLELVITSKLLNEISKSMVNIAEKDEKLAKNLYSKSVIIRDEMKKDNFKAISPQFIQIQQAINSLSSEEEFIKGYKEKIKILKETIDGAVIEDKGTKVTLTFDLDMFNNIKVWDFKINYSGVSALVTIDTTKDFNGKSYNSAQAIDFAQVTNDQNIQKQVMTNVLNKVLKNEELIKFLEENNIIQSLKQMYGTEDMEDLVSIYIDQVINQMHNGN